MLPTALQCALVLVSALVAWGLDDDLLPTPPMGYNTWNDMFRNLNETNVRMVADRLKEIGFLALGYQYIVLDDLWMAGERDSEGRLQGDLWRFKSGIPALSNHIHSLGMKLGIYTSRGLESCMGQPASQGREDLDASTFAQWGVDYLKNDACGDPDCEPTSTRLIQGRNSWTGPAGCRKKAIDKYATMQRALNHTGRHIVHSVCGWQPWYALVGRRLGHMWRIGGDVRDWSNIYEAVRLMEQVNEHHGRNGWNDPDMLIGSSPGTQFKVTPLQARAQFSLWCVLGAPLMLGTSVLRMSDVDRETYGNAEAIRVNQDPLGKPAKVVFSSCPAYPKVVMDLGPDGYPRFDVDFVGTPDPDASSLDCGGGQSVKRCRECPEGLCSNNCEPQDVGDGRRCMRKGLEIPDRPTPFARSYYWSREARQCQQAWARPLAGGDVAVAVVNFAAAEVEMRLPILQGLLSPAPGDSVTMRDLWVPPAGRSASRLVAGNVTGVSADGSELHLRLPPDGGHVLVRLGVIAAAKPAGAQLAEAGTSSRIESEPLQQVFKARDRVREAQAALAEAQVAALSAGVPVEAVLGPGEIAPARSTQALVAHWVPLLVAALAVLGLALRWLLPRSAAQWCAGGHARRS